MSHTPITWGVRCPHPWVADTVLATCPSSRPTMLLSWWTWYYYNFNFNLVVAWWRQSCWTLGSCCRWCACGPTAHLLTRLILLLVYYCYSCARALQSWTIEISRIVSESGNGIKATISVVLVLAAWRGFSYLSHSCHFDPADCATPLLDRPPSYSFYITYVT